jgi:hypothetical protein
LVEKRRVCAAFKARQLGLVPDSKTSIGVMAPVVRSTVKM